MNDSFFSKVNKPLMVLAFASIFTFSATKAYFTTLDNSPENAFVSGNLELSVTQEDVLSVENWKPGDEHILEFKLENTGSMPVHVKANLSGIWDSPELDPSMFQITSLERKVNDVWVQVTQDGLDVGEEFFLSADGTENSLLELLSGEDTEFKLTTKLSGDTPDEYQNKSFVTSLHIAGKQVANGAEWPAEY